jgi:uncharacterized protein (TIGR00255 family)
MIRSMTAFARSSYEGKDFTLDVFVRTYNHRYLDINLKLPIELLHLEGDLRSLISRHLSRGRVEITIKTSFLKEGIYQVFINRGLVGKLISELQAIKAQHELGSDVSLEAILRIPGLVEVQTDPQKISPEILNEMKEIMETTLKSLVEMRAQEGLLLAKDIRERLDSLAGMVSKVEEAAKDYPKEVRASMEKSIHEILDGQDFNEARLLEEVAYYSERSDVTEELVRLRSHLSQCKKLIEGKEPAGRKFDFLLQEILREINTIGSKCALLTVSQTVIEMKTEVEKIREQVQNVE